MNTHSHRYAWYYIIALFTATQSPCAKTTARRSSPIGVVNKTGSHCWLSAVLQCLYNSELGDVIRHRSKDDWYATNNDAFLFQLTKIYTAILALYWLKETDAGKKIIATTKKLQKSCESVLAGDQKTLTNLLNTLNKALYAFKKTLPSGRNKIIADIKKIIDLANEYLSGCTNRDAPTVGASLAAFFHDYTKSTESSITLSKNLTDALEAFANKNFIITSQCDALEGLTKILELIQASIKSESLFKKFNTHKQKYLENKKVEDNFLFQAEAFDPATNTHSLNQDEYHFIAPLQSPFIIYTRGVHGYPPEQILTSLSLTPTITLATEKTEQNYALQNVITRSGTTTASGHYIAYTKYGSLWYICNDENISFGLYTFLSIPSNKKFRANIAFYEAADIETIKL